MERGRIANPKHESSEFDSHGRLQYYRIFEMDIKAFDLTMKALMGEQLTDEEKLYLQKRDAKYKLVQYVYMEKMNHDGAGLTQFEFTPGESFMDTPIVDIVNGLLKLDQDIKDGKYTPQVFGDSNRMSNPPKTGRVKTNLGE